MNNLEYIISIAMQVGWLVALLIAVVLMFKSDKLKQSLATNDKLKRYLDEMDEQAKLIVRTDIELNKTQEELDKKITALYALQRIARVMSTSLEEKEIFAMIKPSFIADVGFEKACGFLWKEHEKAFVLYLRSGFGEEEIKAILGHLASDSAFYLGLMQQAKTLSSVSLQDAALKGNLGRLFFSTTFVIAPILPKEGAKGFLFVGSRNNNISITEGDEELVTILANQIGQALENARLFEQSWRAQQDLEKKVDERTQELTTVLKDVQMINKRKSDFISAVSHELRTPLTSIKGYAAILLTEKLGALPPAVKQRLEKVNIHSDELVHMVNDLLDIARIESGKTVMKIEPQNLSEMIANITDLIAVQCKNKNIELTAEVAPGLPPVLTDRLQIERVFINLLGNAVKFTPQDGKITVKAFVQDEKVQVNISDSGIGIPPDALAKIFDEFYRVDNDINQQVKGTGLGLALVKQIIDAHKGKIWVESTVGQGSSFIFTLPPAEVPAA